MAQEMDPEKIKIYKDECWAHIHDHDLRMEEDIKKHVRRLGRDNYVNHIFHDRNEQYERRDCVVIKNVQEYGPRENLYQLVVDACGAMGGNISTMEISVVHRLGRYVRGRMRPIIVKFTRRYVKSMVMRNKFRLRHVRGWERVYIDENLTDWRSFMVTKIRQQSGVSGVSTNDGKIFFTKDSRKYVANTPQDFLSLPFSDDFYISAHIDPEYRIVE